MTNKIHVEHLARVEGHGGLTVNLKDREIESITFNVYEGIRLFESFLRGKHYMEATGIACRICAICAHNHTLSSLHALEDALKVQVTPQTRKLRDLGCNGSMIESHALHVFFLAFPDFVGHPSAISVASVNPEAVKVALRLKKLGNTIQEVVGGRAVHPVNYMIGGFGKAPTNDQMLMLKKEIEAGLKDAETGLAVLMQTAVPNFVKEPIRGAAIVPDDECYYFGTNVKLTTGEVMSVKDYRKLTNEQCVPYSHAKRSLHDGKSYMVGSLPRLSLNLEQTTHGAKMAAKDLGLTLPSENIVMNNIAQMVELVYSLEHSLALVEGFIKDGIKDEEPVKHKVKACKGAAATEAPRGLLFYEYELDKNGIVKDVDIITPTAQNFNNAEDQMHATVRDGKEASDEELKKRIEIVARAYDPCISCSVH